MCIQGSLIRPALEQRQSVGVLHALEDLELLTSGLLHRLRTAGLVRLRELGAFSRNGRDRHHESNRHVVSSPFRSTHSDRVIVPCLVPSSKVSASVWSHPGSSRRRSSNG